MIKSSFQIKYKIKDDKHQKNTFSSDFFGNIMIYEQNIIILMKQRMKIFLFRFVCHAFSNFGININFWGIEFNLEEYTF
jgi:hypothetical protein